MTDNNDRFAIAVVRTSLNILAQVGETANIDALKGLSLLGTLILETCQNAKVFKEEHLRLTKLVQDMLCIILNHVGGKEAITETQRRALGRIKSELVEVHKSIQKLSKKPVLRRLLSSRGDDLRQLQQCRRKIEDALVKFKVASLLDTYQMTEVQMIQIHQNFDGLEELVDHFRKVQMVAISDLAAEGLIPSTREIVNLPVRPTYLFGRESELDELVSALSRQTAARVAILGAGGIGKTALAKQALHDSKVIEVYGPRRFFVKCDAATTSDGLLTVISSALETSRMSSGGQLDKTRNFLAQGGKRALLVLDNFESPWDSEAKSEVEDLLSSLTDIESLSVIVTMRGSERPLSTEWTRPFFPPLRALDHRAARKTFFAQNDCSSDDPAVDKLLALVDRVPLAITLLARMGQNESPESILRTWEKQNTRILQRPGMNSQSDNVELSIELSIRSYRMTRTPEALELLSALALLPDGIQNKTVDDVFLHLPEARKALLVLRQSALVYDEGDRDKEVYRVLTPIREYVRRELPPQPLHAACMQTYYTSLSTLAERIGTSQGASAVEVLSHEVGNLHSILSFSLDAFIRGGDRYRGVVPLSDAVGGAVRLARLQRFTSLGSTTAIKLAILAAEKQGDIRLKGHAIRALSQVYQYTGNKEESEKLANAALELYRSIDDTSSMSECLHILGQLQMLKGKQRNGYNLYEEALKLAVASGNRHSEAVCLAKMSERSLYRSKLEESKLQSEQAILLFKEMDDLTNLGLSTYWLGRIADIQSAYGPALAYYEEALAYLQRAGAPSQVVRVLISTGDILCIQGKFRNGIEVYEKAVVILEDLELVDNRLGAYTLLSLANAYVELHDIERALPLVDTARATFQREHIAHGLLHCWITDGDIAVKTANYTDAESCYVRVLGRQLEGRPFYAPDDALCNLHLARLHVVSQNYHEAQIRSITAFSAYRALTDAVGQADSLRSYGDALVGQGDLRTALACYAVAIPLLERVHAHRGVAMCQMGLAKVAKAKGQPGRAIDLLQRASALYRECGDSWNEEMCRTTLVEEYGL